jgi:hypothetical protein
MPGEIDSGTSIRNPPNEDSNVGKEIIFPFKSEILMEEIDVTSGRYPSINASS